MSRHTVARKWLEAFCLALGAGFTNIMLQPKDAPLRILAFAFLAASLPVLAIHARHGAAEPRVRAVETPK